MTLELFEQALRKQCKISYADLKDNRRKEKLKNQKITSLKDVMFIGRQNTQKLWQSCIISFGDVLEKTTLNYVELNKEKVYRNKNFLSAKIDIVFKIKKNIYNLESKSNINLDAGKTKKALETLKRKHKMVVNGLDCQNEGFQVISKFLVWTTATSEDAAKIAKKPLEKEWLMGFQNFFNLFKITVSEKEFFSMLQKVWRDEVEKYF